MPEKKKKLTIYLNPLVYKAVLLKARLFGKKQNTIIEEAVETSVAGIALRLTEKKWDGLEDHVADEEE